MTTLLNKKTLTNLDIPITTTPALTATPGPDLQHGESSKSEMASHHKDLVAK